MTVKMIEIPEVYSLEAEARLEVVRNNIKVWRQRYTARRGYPPRLVGVEETLSVSATSSHFDSTIRARVHALLPSVRNVSGANANSGRRHALA